eukprot:TRINITY_DN632_c0_g1_i1.p2 TRINITY_DN632_c0_g1~~TRINITY_DN632_c0_g1_i1.p2  ORF type:complete len:119 (+),score=6.42 TRINITY_DN632_c0_g1_i1:163-519(+)
MTGAGPLPRVAPVPGGARQRAAAGGVARGSGHAMGVGALPSSLAAARCHHRPHMPQHWHAHLHTPLTAAASLPPHLPPPACHHQSKSDEHWRGQGARQGGGQKRRVSGCAGRGVAAAA